MSGGEGMSANARAFIAANKRSAVVSGACIGNGGQGAIYVLRSGREFTLTKADCEYVGLPRWAHAPGPAASTTADSGNEQVAAKVSQPIRDDQIPLLRPSKGG